MRTADGYIINQCLNGNSAAFGILVDRYKESIYALAYSMLHDFHEAEDITQEAFIKAYEKLHTLRSYDRFHAWLFAITTNLCKNWIKSRRRRPDNDFIEDQDRQILEEPSVDHYHEKLSYQSVRDAMESLPNTYCQVLSLYYLGGLKTREIAGFLGITPTAVRHRLRRARARLREEMIAMMQKTFKEQTLPVGFTLNIVEALKHIRIHPLSNSPGIPWGLSIAMGIILAVLGLNPQLGMPGFRIGPAGLPPPGEIEMMEVREMPVDVVQTGVYQETIDGSFQSDNPGGNGFPRQNLFALAPGSSKDNGFPEKPSARLGKGILNGMALSPDGSLLAVAGSIGIWLYDANNLNEIGLLKGHTNDVSSVAFSPDGKILASGSRDNTVRLWDVKEQRQLALLEGHDRMVDTIAFSPDGKILASGGVDKIIRLWNVDERRQIGVLEGHTGYVIDLTFSPDGNLLASCSRVGNEKVIEIWIWNIEEQREISLLEWPTDYGILSVAFSPDGKILASGFGDGSIHLWDVKTGEHLAMPKEHTRWVNCVAFSPDGEILASGSGDSSIRLWNVREKRRVNIFQGKGDIFSVSFSLDGKILTSMSYEGTVSLWDIDKQKEIDSLLLKGYTDHIVSLTFSPDTKLLAVGEPTGIRLWDVGKQKQLCFMQYSGLGFSPNIAFSPDGKTIASGDRLGVIHIFDIEQQREVYKWKHKSYVLTFSTSFENGMSSGLRERVT